MNFLEAFKWLKQDASRVVEDKGGEKYKMERDCFYVLHSENDVWVDCDLNFNVLQMLSFSRCYAGELKLFVWENVLTDYTDGVMFALAHDIDEARQQIKDSGLSESSWDELKSEPRIYEQSIGFHLFGGG